MICIDVFNKYCAIEPIKRKSDSELALGRFECINKMGGPYNVLMTDDEDAINNSGIVQKPFTERHITYIPSRGHPVFAERLIRTCIEILDNLIKPNQQCTGLMYPILLTYNK